MVFFVAQQSHALGLGEIQVNSYMGEPLSATVDLSELGNDYESSLKVRLSSPEEYRKNGFAYPYGLKFKFSIVNESGRQPSVHISSSRAIDEPYMNLLLEVVSPSGRITKIFTFLLDPSPDFYRSQAVVREVPVAQPVKPEISKPVEPVVASPAVTVPTVPAIEPVPRPQTSKHKKTSRTTAHAANNRHAPEKSRRYVSKLDSDTPVSGKLTLSLSTSLSISTTDPGLPLSPRESNDALQEELIAKEKTLKELNSQIAEMQSLIKGLQIKLSLTAGSGVGASGVLAQSGIDVAPVVSQVEPVPTPVKVVVPVVVDEVNTLDKLINLTKRYYRELLAGFAVVLLGGLGYYLRRKRKLESGWIPGGLFDDLSHTQAEVERTDMPAPKEEAVPAKTGAVTTKTLTIGEQSMKVPAYKEQKAQTTLPAEYDLLEEADIYLRFGHDKLAEEVLRDAIKINPTNPEIYLTLLGIFDTRLDKSGFEKTAKELQVFADEATWKKVAEMGRKLDIGNPLYAKS